jgi:hypothetical protein
MLLAGCFLLLLALYSRTGNLNEANQVGDTLAIGVSVAVILSGLTYIIVTHRVSSCESTEPAEHTER